MISEAHRQRHFLKAENTPDTWLNEKDMKYHDAAYKIYHQLGRYLLETAMLLIDCGDGPFSSCYDCVERQLHKLINF